MSPGRLARAALAWALRGAFAAVAAWALCIAVLIAASYCREVPHELTQPASSSLRVLDRSGRLLREIRAGDGKRASSVPLDELGPHLARALVATEDARFEQHRGVDFIGVARAALRNVAGLRVVSGASTLTMQLARTLRPHRRTLWGKLDEATLALAIERSLGKRAILQAYLDRVEFGPGLRGAAAASQAYFGRAPRDLTLAEAALVAGLPQGPSLYAVDRRPELAKRRRAHVLGRMRRLGLIDDEAHERALAEPIALSKSTPLHGAPHLSLALARGDIAPRDGDAPLPPGLREVETTIDAGLQRAVELAVQRSLEPLADRHVTAAAVVVVDNESGDVLAHVGSPDFEDASRLGQNDGTRALRQPGSTLKPFVYALAIERLGYDAATALPDVETTFTLPSGAAFTPRNYDGKLHGPVRLRHALASSLNVPAVAVAERLGPGPVVERLRDLGFTSLDRDPDHYGPGIALGDGDVTLLSLARAYATLARGGDDRPLRSIRRATPQNAPPIIVESGPSRRVMPREIAAIITDILRDPKARAASFGEAEALRFAFDVAAKTGTSKGYRDNWAVGYSSAVTVAAWAGNFDGSPMLDVSGIAGAGPIFHAAMTAAMTSRRASPLPLGEGSPGFKRAKVCALSGQLAQPLCPETAAEWLPAADLDLHASCSVHVKARIDRRNGLLAGPSCSAVHTVERVVERLAAPLDAWARDASRPVEPEGYSPLCPGEGAIAAAGPLRVVYPADGARFVIDPERTLELQAIDVRVEGAPPSQLRLVVDDGPPGSPGALTFTPSPGTHRLVVVDARGERSPATTVHVR